MDFFSYLLSQSKGGGGGGSAPSKKYKSIEYLDKNTVKLIDDKDKEHIIKCSYDTENKIETISIDDVDIPLEYEQQVLHKVGQIMVDLNKA